MSKVPPLHPVKKRSVSVNAKMTPEDWQLMLEAGAKAWPTISFSRSTLLVALGRIGAECITSGSWRPVVEQKKNRKS